MRAIRLHDTRTGEVVPLEPRDPGRVGIYACGPTVYSRIHIGNARPFVVFSLLKRFLEHEGYNTTLVVNVTDVNDKIYDAARLDPSKSNVARRTGRSSAELAAEMTMHYIADTDALGLGRPDREPLASETMDAIIAYIQDLIDSGHAYVVEYGGEGEGHSGSDVLFRVRSDPGYGSLSHRRLDDMDQGEDISGTHPPAERKEDPRDFALWKGHKQDEDTYWDTPWGPGRPGWHIECSAMAESLLGVGFDIHGGGSDLVFPHHENEAAQTRAARGEELARIWMHNGMIQFTGEKMAKSVGNIALLHEVLEHYGRDAVVMYLISGHYRQPLAFSEAALKQARANVSRIKETGRRLGPGVTTPRHPSERAHLRAFRDSFFEVLANDFNTASALASLFEWIRATGPLGVKGDEELREMLSVLCLENLLDSYEPAPQAIHKLAEEREMAREQRDFAAADELRARIAELGWEVRDVVGGFVLLPLAEL
jgi:cysteinyl-tRNA synthetase